jgi:hypothetical protein
LKIWCEYLLVLMSVAPPPAQRSLSTVVAYYIDIFLHIYPLNKA